MKLKQHPTLTKEKWARFPLSQQVLMIGNELGRAGHWLKKKDFAEVRQCYGRALELIYLTCALLKKKYQLKEFLRFKEALLGLYVKARPTSRENSALSRVLFTLDKDSYNILHP